MKKSTFKNLFLIVLFISNSILLFMWWNAPEHRHGGPRNEIIQQLEFTPKQIIKYDQLIKEHRKSIRTLENRISQKKKHLYSSINAPFPDSVANEIIQLEKEILKVHYHHFQEIESICDTKQKIKFQALTKNISAMFSPQPKRHE